MPNTHMKNKRIRFRKEFDFDFLASVANNKVLYPYQTDAKMKIYDAWETHQSVMLQMPTGTGKTFLFSSIVKDLIAYSSQMFKITNKKIYKTLILAHRVELIAQISDSIGERFGVRHGKIISGTNVDLSQTTQVASVQTLSRRLSRYKELDFDFIIIDEAHHALADSYVKIIERFPGAYVLGVTATPYRMSGDGFQHVFDTIVLSDSIQTFINNKYLAEYKYYSIKPDSYLQKMIEDIDEYDEYGDYAEDYLDRKFNTKRIRANIVDNYIRYANGRKGIVYTINQNHNIEVCNTFLERGVKAEYIDSNTPADERSKKVAEFKRGKIDVLCNVNIFSEGFDCPDVEFVQLARPTQSLSLYMQQAGRGLRVHEDKSHVIFLDNVGLYNLFGLPSMKRDWEAYFHGKYFLSNATLSKNGNIGYNNEEVASSFEEEGDEEMVEIFTTIDDNIIDKDIIKNASMSNIFIVHRKRDDKFKRFMQVFEYFDYPYDTVQYPEDDWEEILYECTIGKGNNEIDEEYLETFLGGFVGVEAERFHLVEYKGKYGIWDLGSKDFKVAPLFDKISRIDRLNRFFVEKDGKKGLISAHDWRVLVECKYDEIETFYIDYYIVKLEEKYGIVANGKDIIPLESDFIEYVDKHFIVKYDGFYELYTRDMNKIDFKNEKLIQLTNNLYTLRFNDYIFIANGKKQIIFNIPMSNVSVARGSKSVFICEFKDRGVVSKFLLNRDFEIFQNNIFKSIIELEPNRFLLDKEILVNENFEIQSETFLSEQDINRNKKLFKGVNGIFYKINFHTDSLLGIYGSADEVDNSTNIISRKEKKQSSKKIKRKNQNNNNDIFSFKNSRIIIKNQYVHFLKNKTFTITEKLNRGAIASINLRGLNRNDYMTVYFDSGETVKIKVCDILENNKSDLEQRFKRMKGTIVDAMITS